LPSDRQRKIQQRFQQWQQLSPQKKTVLIQRFQKWQKLTVAQKTEVRRRILRNRLRR
jgi:hypothetical protein